MPEKQVYEYAFIRLVPKVEREEFLNVGVIVFSKQKQFLQVKYHVDEKRVGAFAADLDLAEIDRYLRTWDLICRGDAAGGSIAQLDQANRFRWLTATRSTIIQTSEVHPGLTHQPEKVLDTLFEKYVL